MKIFGGLLALAAFTSAQDIANERRKNNKNKKNNNRGGKYASKVCIGALVLYYADSVAPSDWSI